MSKVEVDFWFDVNWKLYKSYTLCLKKVDVWWWLWQMWTDFQNFQGVYFLRSYV